ncbi:MAG TPA: arginine--tRNA ligase [Verrucomicrobiae bacterium]|nr:arginine--tRNA ligase [Verrucomicrobiae bacterium]
MIHQLLQDRLQEAARQVLPEADVSSLLVRPCPDPKFGDYQCTALILLAKERKLSPRQLAADVLARLDVGEWCEKVELAGAGFINFRLKTSALAQALQSAIRAEHPFVQKAKQPRTIVIDFSSPNVAKPMHVGHIRSTILGDCLAHALRLLGHRVITDNHIGDWGTQFGMLLVGWKQCLDATALKTDPVAEMERIYKKVSSECQENPATLEEARRELVKLQQGAPENLGIWREMIALSQAQFSTIYDRLGVKFDYTLGESFYHPRLMTVVEELRAKGIARESEGAICVFSDGSLPPKEDPLLIHKDGAWVPNPCLIQKSDGGFNYATTDLATLAYRLQTWHPDEIIYITDGRQQLHFKQIFAAFRRWHPELNVKLVHVWFGSILGENGKPFKTRSGETVKLTDLLDEAEERAFKIVSEKNPELSESQRREIARIVGLGAVKFADLLPNRQSDYVFSWDKMLALEGNTAPYLQYACVRIRSIFRKGGAENAERGARNAELSLAAPEESALAKHLLNFGLVLEAVADDYRPNFLCNYLYELAGRFARFYENCPVLKAAEPERATRLALCDLTARVLNRGLEVLGIETTEQM